ncbi:MAG: protein translocase subunit SecD [Chlamydiia bacterium]|nr:protein translocase subunit SecD [Chlamydiia bacterium]
MERQKKWQFFLIIAVISLTLYNILPTVFWYTKPLDAPINAQRAEEVARQIVTRVNQLEGETIDWLHAFSNLLNVKPTAIERDKDNRRLIHVTFAKEHEATRFRTFLPRAGQLIPFVPAQLELYPDNNDPKQVTVARQMGIHLTEANQKELFQYVAKEGEKGEIPADYRLLIRDRALLLIHHVGGASEEAKYLQALLRTPNTAESDDAVINFAKEFNRTEQLFRSAFGSDVALPFLQSYFQSETQPATQRLSALEERLQATRTRVTATQAKEELAKTLNLLQKEKGALSNAPRPFSTQEIEGLLSKAKLEHKTDSADQIFPLQGRHPFISSIVIDWSNDLIRLQMKDTVSQALEKNATTENERIAQDALEKRITNGVASLGRLSNEHIVRENQDYVIAFHTLQNSSSLLVARLDYLAKMQGEALTKLLEATWHPTNIDLQRNVFPIRTFSEYLNEPKEIQQLGLVIYSPAQQEIIPAQGFRDGSLYVVARNLNTLMQRYEEAPQSAPARAFGQDLLQLRQMMVSNGFIGYPAKTYTSSPEHENDYIFELEDFYNVFLKASRENFEVHGNKQRAVLPFTTVEQRLLTENRVDEKEQEDLIKWKEEYQTAQVSIDPANRFVVPPPTKNPYWENFKLTMTKYFRGDDKKILKWGIDLSGGKTVRIGLKDQNDRRVTNLDDLNQAVNELYSRINKMGVSERVIRIENDNIVVEFPGSQNLSASELIQASSMTFHIVNEKFSLGNAALKDTVNQFLQEVWNEAVVTNRKDVKSVNQIAWENLTGGVESGVEMQPKSEVARQLQEAGLKLANPETLEASNTFDDTRSVVGIMRGDDFSAWDGQTHPLMILFQNFALEGASLTNVNVGYDPNEGNVLSFNVERSYKGERSGSPRDDFYAWTSQFAQDRITGTVKDTYSQGRGWRMAVVLNGQIISKPALRSALSDGGQISGRFTQREINQLAADLKAGSLSFSPAILSEQNVSPELGQEERSQGIIASLVALFLVAIAMIGYYRFAGVVACCAIFFNILIMWGVLQNLDAALTLPGIAGIVLAIGMAVDANVLVFERFREEFKETGKLAASIQAGYQKAFSAIVDSNITTIMAALILIQFDSGPIKGFAVTLIIGIVSSMFTALFMTRYYFAGWVKNPKNTSLNFSEWIGGTNIDFLKQAKAAIVISLIVMVAGIGLLYKERKTIFGMDFTGGYSLQVEVENQPNVDSYRLIATEALLNGGAHPTDFEVRQLTYPNQLRIQLAMSMEEEGHPFYQMPERSAEEKGLSTYTQYPRMKWVVDTLEKGGLVFSQAELARIDNNWSVMSGQLSGAMRNNALMALFAAVLFILAYITIRFELKYAIASVVALIHDVAITLGLFALFHYLNFDVQIDLEVIGAIMTIIGYSLNDTIIVFDRIREEVQLSRKMTFPEIINHALNVTLSRTLMTSGTTLLVLIALVTLGGNAIFSFSLVMALGVAVGTLSSLYVASPVMLFFHQREEKEQEHSLRHAS